MRAAFSILFFCGLALAQRPDSEFFESKVRPILSTQCFGCHGDKMQMGGLNLSTAEGFYYGAKSGPIFTKESPEKSHILEVIGYKDTIKMPPSKRLSDGEINDITTWIKMGAPWPGGVQSPLTSKAPLRSNKTAESYWWAQPPRKSAVPAVRASAWVRSPIDNFILAKLEEKSLAPAAPASKMALLRRATYNLTGLPPTVEETQQFLADQSPDAFAHVVDRLLASPRYGERFGRHWLDVARYADSNGLTNDRLYPNAWKYRDYVIDAFNRDLPYDRFVTEQLAGDLLPAEKDDQVNQNGIIATGFLAIGPKPFVEQDKAVMLYDSIDEQINTTSRTFLGMTVACARCHDHKFDPISTKDYYSMAAIFAATKTFGQVEEPSTPNLSPLVAQEVYQPFDQQQKKLAAKQREITQFTEQATERYRESLRPQLAGYMTATWRVAHNEPMEAVVAASSLDPAILKKWVDYFQAKGPATGQRPYLDEWLKSSAENIQKVTTAYEARFDASAARWKKQMTEWDKEVEAVLAQGLVPILRPPFKPESAEDRFFADVGFGTGPFGLPTRGGQEKYFPDDVKERLAALRKEFDGLRKSAPPAPPMANAVAEGKPVVQHVHLRGNYKNQGDQVAAGFPRELGRGPQPAIKNGSGRLELARWLTQPDHLLTARVMVNRIWEWNFGAGLTHSSNNFGRQGEPPSHPELLDYLAVRFVESGWSIKAINRLILLSSTYQMSSDVTPASLKADGANRLWSRFPRRRLDVEEIRDSMLAVDGSLDLKMGGTLLAAGPAAAEDGAEPSAGSRDPMQSTRRTVYLPLRRANLLPLLTLFDFGDAATPSEGRSHTNVAPQALFMMNSTFVEQRANSLTKKLLGGAATPAEFVQRLYLAVLGREPDAEERADALKFLSEAPVRLAPKALESEQQLQAKQSLAKLMLESNEFIYVD